MMNRTTAALCAVMFGLSATAVQAAPQVKKQAPAFKPAYKPAQVKPIGKPAQVKKPAVVKQAPAQYKKPATVPKNVGVKPVNPNLKQANPNLKPINPNLKPAPGVLKPVPVAIKPAPLPIKPGPGKIGPIVPIKPPPNVAVVNFGGKYVPYWKGGGPYKKIWWGGGWKSWVLPATLGVVAVGGAYYYADGYLSLARPYCSGITPDGCRLNWQRVDFLEGGSDWQCVQFCRHVGPPPARTVAFVPPPPLPPQAACEITIFPEPGFAGGGVTTGEEQPQLSQSGWQNASVQVKAGIWDFFSDEQFVGETMRLAPGEYPDLGPDWTKRSGSFMCVQP